MSGQILADNGKAKRQSTTITQIPSTTHLPPSADSPYIIHAPVADGYRDPQSHIAPGPKLKPFVPKPALASNAHPNVQGAAGATSSHEPIPNREFADDENIGHEQLSNTHINSGRPVEQTAGINTNNVQPINPILAPASPPVDAADPWPICRGYRKHGIHHPCKNTPARRTWKKSATQCINCLANAPNAELRASMESRVAAGIDPCSKCYRNDARPGGGLCQECVDMGKDNLELRNEGRGKRKHADLN